MWADRFGGKRVLGAGVVSPGLLQWFAGALRSRGCCLPAMVSRVGCSTARSSTHLNHPVAGPSSTCPPLPHSRPSCQVWWSLATVLTPIAARVSLPVLLLARAAMGIGEGVAMPAMNNLLSK